MRLLVCLLNAKLKLRLNSILKLKFILGLKLILKYSSLKLVNPKAALNSKSLKEFLTSKKLNEPANLINLQLHANYKVIIDEFAANGQ